MHAHLRMAHWSVMCKGFNIETPMKFNKTANYFLGQNFVQITVRWRMS